MTQQFLGVQWIITRRDDLAPPGPFTFADPFLMAQQRDTAEFDSWLKRVAYKTGEFTLRSGQKSSEYLDVKEAILHPESEWIAKSFTLRTPKIGRLAVEYDAVAGMELGGALLANLIAYRLRCAALAIRKEDKGYGSNEPHGIVGMGNMQPGRWGRTGPLRVWLVEDVITTGGAVIQSIERLRKADDIWIMGVLTVVDREQGGIEKIKEALGDEKTPVSAVTTLSKVRAATV